ncbi:MAG: uroporphyrinogen decarboxylase family protein [Armatimonadota bacterium]
MLTCLEDTIIRPAPDFARLRRVLLRESGNDCVPFYELLVDVPMMERILGRPVPDTASTVDFYYRAGYDYVPVWPTVGFTFGSLIDRSSGYPIHDWETFEKYPWPTPESVEYTEFESVTSILPEGMAIIGQTSGIFEAVQSLMGYEQLCYMLVDDPALIEAIFERLSEIYESMYKGMADIENVGAVVISDDMGFKTSTLLGADDLRRYVLPRHRRLAEIVHAAGEPCILHSCGQLAGIMEDIIDYVGIDAKHSYEDSIIPVTEAKRLYGDRIAILGGFDLDRLCRSSESEVREYTRMLVAELGAQGGYALGSGNSIAKYVPVENYLAMLDEGWRTRR